MSSQPALCLRTRSSHRSGCSARRGPRPKRATRQGSILIIFAIFRIHGTSWNDRIMYTETPDVTLPLAGPSPPDLFGSGLESMRAAMCFTCGPKWACTCLHSSSVFNAQKTCEVLSFNPSRRISSMTKRCPALRAWTSCTLSGTRRRLKVVRIAGVC